MTDVLDVSALTPPRISLLSAANIVPVPLATNEDPAKPRRWESGFTVDSYGGETTTVSGNTTNNSSVYVYCSPDPAIVKTAKHGGQVLSYTPFVISTSETSSTWPNRRDIYERATKKLVLAESTILEKELWTSTLGNPSLTTWTDSAGNVNTPTTIALAGSQDAAQGLSVLDQAIASCTSGRGMIHIRPILLQQLLLANVVRREGNVYLSPMDNIVVPGRGYPGTGPAAQAVGATEWMYASVGIVEIRHSEIVWTPPVGNLAQAVTRTTNDYTVWAERVTHAALDYTAGPVFTTEVTSTI